RVSDNFGVIERQPRSSPVLHKFRRSRVVAAFSFACAGPHQKCATHAVRAWIALRIGINADESEDFSVNAGFFAKLPERGILDGFADVDKTAGQCVGALERRLGALDQQQPASAIEYDAIHGEQRRLRFHYPSARFSSAISSR